MAGTNRDVRNAREREEYDRQVSREKEEQRARTKSYEDMTYEERIEFLTERMIEELRPTIVKTVATHLEWVSHEAYRRGQNDERRNVVRSINGYVY